jgi:hypothetical protein
MKNFDLLKASVTQEVLITPIQTTQSTNKQNKKDTWNRTMLVSYVASSSNS